MTSSQSTTNQTSLTNYISYHDPRSKRDQIGHYNLDNETVVPLNFISGAPIDNLYQVIEVGEANIVRGGTPYPIADCKILPPITGRDILCVGKNYAEHAKEFNSSGFDSSDKVDVPSHPVIFTKRHTSIIAHGEGIYPHPEFTQTLDYEGEIGVIIGKSGYRISEVDAMSHVWGYTIINDVTARERQRDHKQFYIGKSADTFCPMGPIAVPASRLDKVLRVQTVVNGELRQDATTEDLIFSIPYLIKTMSEGQTLMPGDVLATGTPAGVGIGRKPPVYLKSGDTVKISVTGLGSLVNTVADPSTANSLPQRAKSISHMPPKPVSEKYKSVALTTINNKPLYYWSIGNYSSTRSPIVFVHGLGGTSDYFTPLISALNLPSYRSLHLYDFEGHGLSPTSLLSKISIDSLAADLASVFEHAGITSGATLIAHSIGCLVAIQFILAHPGTVDKLILLAPPPAPLPIHDRNNLIGSVHSVRACGMSATAKSEVDWALSKKTRDSNYLAVTAAKMMFLGQDPEGYAKACMALAEVGEVNVGSIEAETLIITGREDEKSSMEVCEGYEKAMGGRARMRVLEDVRHWHAFEDCEGLAKVVGEFIGYET